MSILAVLTLIWVFLSVAGDKRLLLNDPDVLTSRIDHLEEQLRQQSETIRQQADTIKQFWFLVVYNRILLDQLIFTGEEAIVQHITPSSFIQKKNCKSLGREVVRKGYTAGGGSGEAGASPDFVCLPQDPKLKPTSGHDYGRIYGTEYNTDFWGMQNFNNEVPCAVCRSTNISNSIMIPGKDTCIDGWKTEYHGFLGSSRHESASGSSFICIDINHTSLPGGNGRYDGGRMLFNVKAFCGALQCPPYKNGYSLTCAVCSK